MRAIAITAYGEPERLQVMDLPIPQLGPDEVLERLSRLVEAGSLWVPVQQTLPLEEAARAQELLQHSHVQGKLVLAVA